MLHERTCEMKKLFNYHALKSLHSKTLLKTSVFGSFTQDFPKNFSIISRNKLDNYQNLCFDRNTKMNMQEIRRLLLTGDIDQNGKIDLELDNQTGIARLCMNNPIRKNGFNGKMMNEFSDVLDRLENWKEV